VDQLSPSVGVLLQLQLKYVSGTVLSPDIITDPKMAEAFYLHNVVPNDKKNSFSPYKAIVWSQNYDPGSLNQTVSDWSNLYSEKFTGPSGETWAWEGKVYGMHRDSAASGQLL
jgi:hypothetical protein